MINTHRVIELKNRPCIIASSSCVGQKEAEGPLKDEFDICFNNDGIDQSSWEMAECELLRIAVGGAMDKANLSYSDIGVVLAGDLLNQCSASNYAVRNENVPFAGLFGACSTMAYSTALASLFVDGKYVNNAIAATSSHFCSAEKQFRYPLEYGAQRPPAAQRTVTGAGALLISDNKSEICVPRILFGSVVDLGLTDTSNMGAAMAPAAAKSIYQFLSGTNSSQDDFDLILTGDLGKVGSELLISVMRENYSIDISSVHDDCGLMIYDLEKQDVHSGGSGCGCSAVVVASLIMKRLINKDYKRVLFAGTGALMSPLISLQGESIPAICHIVEFQRTEVH